MLYWYYILIMYSKLKIDKADNPSRIICLVYYAERVKEYRILRFSLFVLHFLTPTQLLKVVLKRYHSIRGLRHAPC